VSQPGTLLWLARHELRLGWRDWVAMMTVGNRQRMRAAVIALIVFVGFMHLLAYSLVRRYALTGIEPDKATLVVVTGICCCCCRRSCRRRWSWLHASSIRVPISI